MEDKYLDIKSEDKTELVNGEHKTEDAIVNQEAKEIIAPDPTRETIELVLLNTPIVEEPVVVNPDTVSKTASVNLGISPVIRKGTHPMSDSRSQLSAVTTQPSLR